MRKNGGGGTNYSLKHCEENEQKGHPYITCSELPHPMRNHKKTMDKKPIMPDLDVQMDDTTRVAVREGGAQLSPHTQQPASTLYISFMDKGSRL
jgi:hypothetical protein